ncbi:MAG: serine/threonine protein kinase [bacterium]|nr:serine/threonine protein kinase [bacterium]
MAALPTQLDRVGAYKIVKQLGKGSMGVVYEALPDGGGVPVAIKVFYPDTQLPPQELDHLRERFEREGRQLSTLHHRNVVQVFEYGKDGTTEFIVMEKLEGFNLKELFELGTRFTLAETFDIILQLLAGLTACHRANVVHRDVKPANVVRGPDGTIKLTDFGIARVMTDQTLARSGTVVGTPNYMSPEQIRGEDTDPRSDLFSAGVLMYELLTAKKPFDGPDVTAIMYNVTAVQPPSPRFYNGVLPQELDEIGFRALAKKPDERFSSAEEFSQALRDLEQSLHYRDGTEAILSALPSAPDADALVPVGGGAGVSSASMRNAAGRTSPRGGSRTATNISAISSQPSLPSLSMQGPLAAGIHQGIVYCVDCGQDNSDQGEFCTRCMHPLLRRDIIHKLAQQHARMYSKSARKDYIFLGCLSSIMVGTAILILYLFFKGVS